MSEQEEFKARLAEEREFKERFAREQAAKLRKLHADTKRIQQVVSNLVGTAVSAKPPAVVVPIATKTKKAVSLPGEWRLEVTDRHLGMMQRVVAYRDGKATWQFDLERTRDGFVKQIFATQTQ